MKGSQRTLVSAGLDILLLIVLWALLAPIVFLLVILILIRLIVHHLARIFRPDLIPIYNFIDNVIIQFPSSSRVPFNGSVIFELQGKLELKVFRKHFYELFLSTPDLRQRYKNLFCYYVQWGMYFFKKAVDEVNLEERIREEFLIVKSDKDTDEFVGRWLETNDYGENPNWEILLLHIRRSDDINRNDERTKVLYKIDHGISDGYTSIHFIERLTGVKSPYLVESSNISFFKKVELFLNAPRIILDIAVNLVKTEVLPWGDKKRKELGIFISFTTLDLEKVKAVRRLAKCHFNTILGVIQGLSLKKFLLAKLKEASLDDENMNNEHSHLELPEYTFLPAPTGWPMHPAMTKGTMGNHLSVSMFRMRMREDDPAETLLQGEQDFLQVQANGMSEMIYLFLFKCIWGVPPVVLRNSKELIVKIGLLSKISHAFSPLLLSNDPYQLLGIPVEHIYMPLQPLTFAVSSGRMLTIPVTNGGRLDISIGGRVDSFENKEELDYFTKVMMKDSLDELFTAFKKRQHNVH